MAVSDIANRLSDDAAYAGGGFYTAVFSYGMGVVELLSDWGWQPGGPDQAAYVEIEVDLGAAEVYSEGQAMATAIESTYREAQFAFKHFRGVVRETGHERRARGPNDEGARVKDPERKVQRAIAAIKLLMATTFDDAAIYGIQGIISASTYNFGNQSRSTYTKLASYEVSADSAGISTALLNKCVYRGADSPYGAAPDLILASPTQIDKLAEVAAGKLYAPSMDVAGGLHLIPTGMRAAGAEVVSMPNLTNSVCLFLTGARRRAPGDSDTGNKTNWGLVWNEPNPGRFHVLDLGAGGLDQPMNLQISTACAIVCNNPQQQVKLHTLSTG